MDFTPAAPLAAVVVPCLAIVLVAGLIIWAVFALRAEIRFQAQRQIQPKLWAERQGYHYVSLVAGIATRGPDAANTGSAVAKSRDVITGTTPAGHHFCSFVYEDALSDGKMTVPVHAWMVAMQLPRQMPLLAVSKKTVGNKIAQVLGQRSTVNSDDFNRAFHVDTRRPDFAKDFLHPAMIEWLLGPGRAMVPFRISDDDCVWSRPTSPDYDQLGDQLTLMDEMYARTPASIWDDYGRVQS